MVMSVTLETGTKMLYIDEDMVKKNLSCRGYGLDAALCGLDRSDLTTHVYEGGFKLWESSLDLCDLIEKEIEKIKDKRIIELGCGVGLPSILAAKRGANRITLQDFNECVIRCFTEDNVLLNGVDLTMCEFVSGPWDKLDKHVPSKSFDVIFTSETIYNETDYASLHQAFNYTLSDEGFIWVAAKLFYFGVGGNIPDFISYINAQGVFTITSKMMVDSNIPRQILELRRK